MKLSEASKRKGISQSKHGREIHVSLKHYPNLEYGTPNPTVTIALHICEILKVDLRTIDEWNDRRQPS